MFKKIKGDVHVFIYGLMMSLFMFIMIFAALRITQLNVAYNELDEVIVSSILSSAIPNREMAAYTKQVVIHELDKYQWKLNKNDQIVNNPTLDNSFSNGSNTFNGVLNESSNYTKNDPYLQKSYDTFDLILKENYQLNEDLVPSNPIINGAIEVLYYDVYNYFREVEEDGSDLTGDFRICKHRYDVKNGVWDEPILYDINQRVLVADSLLKENVEITSTTVVTQLSVKTQLLPNISLFFGNGYNESNLLKQVYYQRVVDIPGVIDNSEEDTVIPDNPIGPNAKPTPADPDPDHVHTESSEILQSPATCISPAYYYKQCLTCGVVLEQWSDASATGHEYNDATIIKSPTCYQTGSQERMCYKCGYVERTVIPALGHSYSNEYIVDKEATCATPGIKSKHCLNGCGKRADAEYIPTLDHIFSSSITVTNAADCTHEGLGYRACSNALCSAKKKVIIPALNHNYKNGTCENCGAKQE